MDKLVEWLLKWLDPETLDRDKLIIIAVTAVVIALIWQSPKIIGTISRASLEHKKLNDKIREKGSRQDGIKKRKQKGKK